jgi:hypothetical protein
MELGQLAQLDGGRLIKIDLGYVAFGLQHRLQEAMMPSGKLHWQHA